MPEIAGQRISGSPLNEHECFEWATEGLLTAADSLLALRVQPGATLRNYTHAIAGIKTAAKCLEGAALLRGNLKWAAVVRELDTLEDNLFKIDLVPVVSRGLVMERYERVLRQLAWYVGQEKDRRGQKVLLDLPRRAMVG